ncbi:MAG: (2Fe-2S)-binding protein [Clostridia bacterium]|nr:(2Fe-2S)-binding protein [Deltaproteobacteria bacterium]
MIVCLCHSVSERTLDVVIADGATTVADVTIQCGAGAGCGACHCTITDKINRAGCTQKFAARLSLGSLPIIQPALSAA